ncbi:hypothetical protein [Acetobacterium tundrae]|uniref:Flagellar protein FliT n=1 Tax=Acetobacterium tundrae TaxID=132932 RepID=A0ABR6WKZ8_9FIRM|nr:hypothetical protein [Acetobacterium tundrae]MBC3797044.1 hypothetical protein [Acetobacterium tundrae]
MNDDVNEFCRAKIRILKEYVSKSEELLSSLKDWESIAGILENRDDLIKKLQNLEISFEEKNSRNSCSQEQKKKIDDLIKLISEIDQDVIKQIQEEQKKTMQGLKINHTNQKIANYGTNTIQNYGTFMDVKK